MGEGWPKIWTIKDFLRGKGNEVFTAALIVLVAIGGFGLGRLSVIDEQKNSVKVLSANVLDSTEREGKPDELIVPSLEKGGQVVASKTGTKYHLPWCAGAKTIKEENKVWFDSYEEARAAGYTPAANCKGLE